LEIFSNFLFKEKQTWDLKNKSTPLILYLTLHMLLLKQQSPSNWDTAITDEEASCLNARV